MRRARIKAVANLSTARRPAVKAAGTHNENAEKPCDAGSHLISIVESAANSSLNQEDNVPISATESQDPVSDHERIRKHQDGNQQISQVPTTFKTPLQMPRNDHCGLASSQSADKSRRFKIAPRLNASRSVVAKARVIC